MNKWTEEKRLDMIANIAAKLKSDIKKVTTLELLSELDKILYLAAMSDNFLEINKDKFMEDTEQK